MNAMKVEGDASPGAKIFASGAERTLASLAKALTAAGIEAVRGKATWSPTQVSRLPATIES